MGVNGDKMSTMFQIVRMQVFIPGYGEHQVFNALAALAAVNEMGMDIKKEFLVLQPIRIW